MIKQNLSRLSLLVLATFFVVLLTGCTFFNKTEDISSEEQREEESEIAEEDNQTITLQIVDQNETETNIEISLSKGENVYELLNKAMASSENFTIEFDSFEFNGEPAFSISAINGYNPSENNQAWIFKINDGAVSTGISDSFPEDGDIIRFELEALE